jgi:hypothetical protein
MSIVPANQEAEVRGFLSKTCPWKKCNMLSETKLKQKGLGA